MISSKSWIVDRSLCRHYGSLRRSSGPLRRVETVKAYTRKRRLVLKREDGELKVAVRSTVVKKACADCRATSTPLWRRGPNGPRILCSACGIRYRRGLHPKCGQSNDSSLSSSSSSSTTTGEGLSYEELKQRQTEKQVKMQVLLGRNKKNRDISKEHPTGIGTKSSVAAVSGKKEAEEAALLLLSLSSGILVH